MRRALLPSFAAALLIAGCSGGEERNEDFDREVNADAGRTGSAGSDGGGHAADGDDADGETREVAHVSDEAGLLDSREIDALGDRLDDIERDTGHAIEIEIVPALDGETAVDRAGAALMAGDADILIFAARDEGQIAIVRRPELAAALPVPLLQEIVDRFGVDTETLSVADSFAGAADSIATVLQGQSDPLSDAPPGK